MRPLTAEGKKIKTWRRGATQINKATTVVTVTCDLHGVTKSLQRVCVYQRSSLDSL